MLQVFRFPLGAGQQWPATEGGRQLPFFNWLRVHVRVPAGSVGGDVACSWSGPVTNDQSQFDELFEAGSRRTRKIATLHEQNTEGGWPHTLHFLNVGAGLVNVDVLISDEPIVDLSSGGIAQLLAGLPLSASNPMPVAMAEQAATSGAITNNGQIVGPVAVAVDGTVTVSISGVYAGVSGIFEVSDDGGATWFPVQGARTDSFTAETGPAALTNTNRAWDVPVIGVTHFRFRATAWTSGSATIRITPTGGYVEPSPSVGLYDPITGDLKTMLVVAGSAGAEQMLQTPAAAGDTGNNTTLAAAMYGYLGTANTQRLRVANIFKPIAAVAVVAGTPVGIWTPAAGKKFRVQGFVLGLSVAGAVILKDAGTEIARVLVAAGGSQTSPPMANGILSALANNALQIDASASGNVSGFVFGNEE